MINLPIPKSATDLVGTTQTFAGGVFRSYNDHPPTEMMVIACRWSNHYITKPDQLTGERVKTHPCYEFLVKSDTMDRSKWTRPFPAREYVFNNGDWIEANKVNANV